jgi:hypothetical protein
MIIKVRREGAKLRALRLWHKWFAWFPIRVESPGKKDIIVWLETVERKLIRTGSRVYPWRYIYRIEALPKDSA